jgi:DNA-binding response OmpR family regulator
MVAWLWFVAGFHLMIRQAIDYWEEASMTDLVFVLDGDLDYLATMNETLSDAGYIAAIWAEYTRSYDLIRTSQPFAVLVDLSSDRVAAGLSVLRRLRNEYRTRDLPIIVTSDDEQILDANEALLDAMRCQLMPKPIDVHELLIRLRLSLTAVRDRSTEREFGLGTVPQKLEISCINRFFLFSDDSQSSSNHNLKIYC